MFAKIDKNAVRKVRHHRQRRDLNGTCDRPRLNVYRSTNHIYAQIIDDTTGNTLAAASTLDAQIKGELNETENFKLEKNTMKSKVVFLRSINLINL